MCTAYSRSLNCAQNSKVLMSTQHSLFRLTLFFRSLLRLGHRAALYACILTVASINSLVALSSEEPPPSEGPLFSHPEQIAHISAEGEAVHPMLKYFQPVSGQWSITETDLTVNGAESLGLSRVLLSPCIKERYHPDSSWDCFRLYEQLARPGNGWTFFPSNFSKQN